MKNIILGLAILGIGTGAVYAEDIMQYKNKSHKCEKKYGSFTTCFAIKYLIDYHEIVTKGESWGYRLPRDMIVERKAERIDDICGNLYNSFTRTDESWRLDTWTIDGKVVLPAKACD